MAEMGPPRIARMQQSAGRLKIMHPRAGGGGIPRAIHAGGEGGGGGGGGLARSFGGGAGETRESGDPAVNGNFERMPHTYLYGFPIAGGGLSDRGKEQQDLNGRLQQYNQKIQGMTQQGATFQEAFRALARSNPEALNDLMAHPTALQSMEHLTQVLGGTQQQKTQVKGDDGKIYNVDMNPDGSIGNPQDVGIPGKPGTAPGEGTGKTFTQTTDLGNGKQGTREMQYVRGPNGLLQAVPVEGSEGVPKASGKPTPLAQADIAGLPPQVTSDVPKTAFNRQNYNTLAATPDVMAALGRIQDAAAALGPIKGPLAALSGEYFGLNGTGAQFKADRDLIQSQAQKMAGSGYAAATKNFMEGIGTASNAPSFLKLQAGQLQTTLRNEGQSLADKETADHQGKLPPSLATQLIKQGIVPNGYQSQQTFDGMPPGEASLWKSRFAPQALAPTDKAQLALDAAHGKFGPPGAQNTNTDFKNIIGIRQQDKVQEQAKQQQGTASAAAKAAQAPQPLQGGQQPAPAQPQPGTEPGATQPPQPNQRPQGQQQQPQQPAAPNDLQQNGQQGQAENPQGSAQGTPPTDASNVAALTGQAYPANLPAIQSPQLMPPTAVPGQPAQGMPATNATTPQAPPSPLPGRVSQMLTPQGSVPTPATQAPVSDTISEGGAAAPLPPLSPDTMKTLKDGGVPTEAIANQTQ